MIFNFLFRLLIPYWEELVLNPQTGKPSAKNLFAAISFIVGIAGAIASMAADLYEHRLPNLTAVLLLLGNGGLLAGMKVYQQQANRRTADEAGQPLAVPPPAEHAPEVMPQVENPNAPANQPDNATAQ